MTILEAYTRVFVESDDLETTVDAYRRLLDGVVSLRFSDPVTGLDLAAVTAPAMVARFESLGIEQIEPIRATPVGRKSRARHRDGLVVEYVEARGG